MPLKSIDTTKKNEIIVWLSLSVAALVLGDEDGKDECNEDKDEENDTKGDDCSGVSFSASHVVDACIIVDFPITEELNWVSKGIFMSFSASLVCKNDCVGNWTICYTLY